MCVVSMVTQHYYDTRPNYRRWSTKDYQDFKELIRKAEEYDKLMGQPDCPDFDKQEWRSGLDSYMTCYTGALQP